MSPVQNQSMNDVSYIPNSPDTAINSQSLLNELFEIEASAKPQKEIRILDVLSHRLLDFIALEISQMGDVLGLEKSVKEDVWDLMKHMFQKAKYVFVNRYVDQLLLCSFYAINRIRGLGFQFKEIINKFVSQSYFPKKVKQSIIHKCLLRADVHFKDGLLFLKTYDSDNKSNHLVYYKTHNNSYFIFHIFYKIKCGLCRDSNPTFKLSFIRILFENYIEYPCIQKI